MARQHAASVSQPLRMPVMRGARSSIKRRVEVNRGALWVVWVTVLIDSMVGCRCVLSPLRGDLSARLVDPERVRLQQDTRPKA